MIPDRKIALDSALHWADGHDDQVSADGVLVAAEKFYEFLTGYKAK